MSSDWSTICTCALISLDEISLLHGRGKWMLLLVIIMGRLSTLPIKISIHSNTTLMKNDYSASIFKTDRLTGNDSLSKRYPQKAAQYLANSETESGFKSFL
ncbi:hypothetical protein SK128_002843 [Halocaridina rubra]|uniref:Uncharacterized protein n=1 Tax=Halocaridina rubra TaxID=373956 RepID=A0AAN8XCJ2_HALRR